MSKWSNRLRQLIKMECNAPDDLPRMCLDRELKIEILEMALRRIADPQQRDAPASFIAKRALQRN